MSRKIYIETFEKELLVIIRGKIGLVDANTQHLLAFSLQQGYNTYAILLAQNLFQCQNFLNIFQTWKFLYSYRLSDLQKIEENLVKVHFNSSRWIIHENKTH